MESGKSDGKVSAVWLCVVGVGDGCGVSGANFGGVFLRQDLLRCPA